MSKPTLVYVEQFYYPDGWAGAQIPRDITIHLAKRGFDVVVVCGSDPYAAIVGDPEPSPQVHGVKIVRLPSLRRGDIHSLKLLRQLWFYLMVIPVLLLRRRPAAYLVQTNPPLIVPIAALVALLRRVPLLIIAQDIYPEVIVAHGMLRDRSVVARFLRAVFGWAYRRADCIVALGTAMARRIQAKGAPAKRIAIISNWATGDGHAVRGQANELRRQWGLSDKFVILYSGNLGVAHNIELPLAALELAVQRHPELHLMIIGKGSRLTQAQALVKNRGLDRHVSFRPLVPTALLPQSLGLADIALVTLLPGFEGLVVPSKFLGYMARGIPTAYLGPDSDVAHMIRESGGGVALIDQGPEYVAAKFVELATDGGALRKMGEAAAGFYNDHFASHIALERYHEIVVALCHRQ